MPSTDSSPRGLKTERLIADNDKDELIAATETSKRDAKEDPRAAGKCITPGRKSMPKQQARRQRAQMQIQTPAAPDKKPVSAC